MTDVQIVTQPCMVCHKNSIVVMTADQHKRYSTGRGHIQDDLPELSPGERELLITGTHPDCWEKMFADADADDDEGADYLRDEF